MCRRGATATAQRCAHVATMRDTTATMGHVCSCPNAGVAGYRMTAGPRMTNDGSMSQMRRAHQATETSATAAVQEVRPAGMAGNEDSVTETS